MQRGVLILTVLLAGFLGFVSQPILGKFVLPLLGGGGGVWTIVSIGFQMGLLLGYCYSLFLLSLKKSTQMIVHFSFGIGTVGVLVFFSGVFFDQINVPVFLSGVGLSYIFIATTTPLVQGWLAGCLSPEQLKPVYRLFSYSNLAAIGGLFAYPFFIEAEMGWASQVKFWVFFYLLYLLFLLQVALKFGRQQPLEILGYEGKVKVLYWMAIPAISTAYLLTISHSFSQNIPPVPIIWTIPLSLYLFSYALAFFGWGKSSVKAILSIFVFIGVAYLFSGETRIAGMSWAVFPVHCGVFFGGCFLLHSYLFDLRPSGRGVALFYVSLGVGGLFGGVFALLMTPLLFPGGDEIWLFHLFIGSIGVVGGISLVFQKIRPWVTLGIGGAVAAGVFLLAMPNIDPQGESFLKKVRTFHGLYQVKDSVGWTLQRELVHGGTVHGSQSLVIGEGGLATTYYTRESGIGAVVEWFRQQNRGLDTLCVGVGTGTVAAWAGAGDSLYFIDIDSEMITTAQQDFSYVDNAKSRGAEITFINADGRKGLSLFQNAKLDFLILDAFSGGGVPLHLLTQEAFLEYGRVLNDSGIIAVHVSSRALDLTGVAEGGLVNAGFYPIVLTSDGGGIGTPSIWVVGTKNSRVAKDIKSLHRGVIGDPKGVLVWSDDFSSIYRLFK